MKKTINIFSFLVNTIIIFVLANFIIIRHLLRRTGIILISSIILFLVIQIKPIILNNDTQSKILRNNKNGCQLLKLFLGSTTLSLIYPIIYWAGLFSVTSITISPKMWIINSIIIILVETIVFWNGIIRIYMTSKQLGIRWRILGILCGWIPIANVIILLKMIYIVESEVKVENQKTILNNERSKEQICKTKYPILMVHGVFFRYYRYLNYWGRIPKELEKNGATIYYGNHHSASSVEDSAKELTTRIKKIVDETGCEKLNVIAHSKGGLDCRYAIAMTGASPYVASLTTINTPHRGCEFADYLLSKIPKKQQIVIAKSYNSVLKKMGDTNPNFLEAVYDLTSKSCIKRNKTVKDIEGIFYQSVGSKLNYASNGRFPLNYTYQLVKYFDGYNDGLVGEKSFP